MLLNGSCIPKAYRRNLLSDRRIVVANLLVTRTIETVEYQLQGPAGQDLDSVTISYEASMADEARHLTIPLRKTCPSPVFIGLVPVVQANAGRKYRATHPSERVLLEANGQRVCLRSHRESEVRLQGFLGTHMLLTQFWCKMLVKGSCPFLLDLTHWNV